LYAQVQSGDNAVAALLRAATILRAHGAAPAAEELLDQLVDEEPQRAPAAKVTLAARADVAPASSPKSDPKSGPKTGPSVGSNDPMQPLLVRTITYRTAPIQTAALAPMPALQPAATRPAQASAAAAPAGRPQQVAQLIASSEPAPIETAPEAAKAEQTKPEPAKPDATKTEPTKTEPTKAQPAKAELPKSEPPAHAHGGWLIQIGAFEAEDEAKQHLSAAQAKVHNTLAAADPFTERIQKGDKALYRARFAGFDKATAEATCKQLKRNDIACMALKN